MRPLWAFWHERDLDPTCYKCLNEYSTLGVQLQIKVLESGTSDPKDHFELQGVSSWLACRVQQILEPCDQQLADSDQQRMLKSRDHPALHLMAETTVLCRQLSEGPHRWW